MYLPDFMYSSNDSKKGTVVLTNFDCSKSKIIDA